MMKTNLKRELLSEIEHCSLGDSEMNSEWRCFFSCDGFVWCKLRIIDI